LTKTLLKYLLPFLVLICFSQNLSSQEINGARAAALNGTAVTLDDVWGNFHNQAGLASVESFSAGAFFQNRFSVNELSDRGVALATPLGAGTIGLALRSFGYSAFSDNRVGLAYALRLTKQFSAGVQLNYHSLRIAEGFGSQNAVSIEVGTRYAMNEKLILAAHIANPNRAKLASFNDERRPTTLRAGVTYVFSEKVALLSEFRLVSDQRVSVRGGVEYNATEQFALRIGAGTFPNSMAFGLGYAFKQWRADFASSWHSTLGFSPQVSLCFVGNEKK
jgi:hypothetical protein